MATPEQIQELMASNQKLQEAFVSAFEKSTPNTNVDTHIRLESFVGKRGQDVEKWIRKFENKLSCLSKVSSLETQAAELACHLTGPAETWYCSLPSAQARDASALKEALRKRFSLEGLKWQWRQQLASKKQSKSESLEDYIESIGNLCQRLELNDKEKLHYFVQGLSDGIKKDVLMRLPKSYEEAEELARLNVSVNNTGCGGTSENSPDLEKATLLRLLEKVMPQPTVTPKVSALDNSEMFNLKKELRELKDELRTAVRGFKQSQSFRSSGMTSQPNQGLIFRGEPLP